MMFGSCEWQTVVIKISSKCQPSASKQTARLLCADWSCVCLTRLEVSSMVFFKTSIPSCGCVRTQIKLLFLYSKQWPIEQTYKRALIYNTCDQIFMGGQWTTMIECNIRSGRAKTGMSHFNWPYVVFFSMAPQLSSHSVLIIVLK